MPTTIPDDLPAHLRQKFASIRKAQAFSRFVTVLLILAVVGEFGWFSYTTYYPISDSFNDQARVQKAMTDAVPDVQPVVVDTLRKVVGDVAPEYRKLAAARYEKVRNSLGAKVHERFTALPDQAEKVLGSQLRDTFDRVLTRLEPDLKTAFPTLTDAQRQDLIINHFHESISAKNEQLAAKVNAIRDAETDKLKKLLDSFALPPDAAVPAGEQMDKEFERVVLMLANEEIQERVEALNTEIGKGPATAPAPKK